jgi:hypothetical protein
MLNKSSFVALSVQLRTTCNGKGAAAERLLGASGGEVGCAGGPKIISAAVVPTNTLPSATVGTENLTADPKN